MENRISFLLETYTAIRADDIEITALGKRAGKSTTLKRALDGSPDTYLPIDPDAFKVLLIEEAIKSGEINTFYNIPEVKQLTDQGEKFFPMDFGSLVHQESTYLAEELLKDAQREDKNVILDRVYSNPSTLQRDIDRLQKKGYQDVSLINVEVTQENSHNRVYSRWEHDYSREIGRASCRERV